jgi:hypothetical protein
MPLIPKRHNGQVTIKELLRRYQEWYCGKFNEDAPLTSEINIRGYGHVYYSKIVIVIYNVFKKDINEMIRYCDFIFKSWSEASGGGATIRFFPNWLASTAMMAQYGDSIKTAMVKKKSECHATYSDHSSIGKSKDTEFVSELMYGTKSISRNKIK